MFADLWNWLIEIIHSVWYPGLFIASFLENLIPPIPSEVIMPLGGYLAATGKLGLVGVILICAVWSTLGNIPYYFIGMYFNKAKIKKFVHRYGRYFFTKEDYVDDLFDVFMKNDRKIVFFARFLPGARAFIGIPAGSVRMNFLQFVCYTFAGTTVRTVFLVFLWYWFGSQYDIVVRRLNDYDFVMYPLSIIWLFFIFLWIYIKKKNKK